MANFKIGDVVRLKSGGPQMTVEHVGEPTGDRKIVNVNTIWFGDGAFVRHYFDANTLEIANPQAKSAIPQVIPDRED